MLLISNFKDSTKPILSFFGFCVSSTAALPSSGNSLTHRQLIVLTPSQITPHITATIRHPAAPPPKASTAPVTANPITIFVATANMKRIDPS